MDLSVVVPVYNEVENVPLLWQQLHDALDTDIPEWEVVFVDDGSTDGSTQALEDIAAKDPAHVRVVTFRRNYGQSLGMAAGIDHACGRYIALMDGDLQNDPADIPAMLAQCVHGYDAVFGWRVKRQDTFLMRRLPSLIANRLIARVTGVTMHDWGCSLKVFRREILTSFRLYGEMHRFIPAFAKHVGARMFEMPVRHHARRFGTSKYGISRVARVLIDLCTVRLLTAYATKPGYYFGYTGMGFGIAGAVAGVGGMALLFSHLWHHLAWFALGSAMLLGASSIHCLLLGMLAEMLMRAYFESPGRRPYLVKRTLNLEDGIYDSAINA